MIKIEKLYWKYSDGSLIITVNGKKVIKVDASINLSETCQKNSVKNALKELGYDVSDSEILDLRHFDLGPITTYPEGIQIDSEPIVNDTEGDK